MAACNDCCWPGITRKRSRLLAFRWRSLCSRWYDSDDRLPDLVVANIRLWLRSSGRRVCGHFCHPQDARSPRSCSTTVLSAASRLRRGQFARLLHIALDLPDQRINAFEFLFGPEITEEAHFQIFAVNPSLEI